MSRLQRSDLDQATLDGLRIMADRLYSSTRSCRAQLLVEGRSWLRRVVSFRVRELLTSPGHVKDDDDAGTVV